MAYLIVFESADSGVKAGLVAAIEDMGDWVEVTSQSYLLETKREVRSIMETLQPMLGPNDNLWTLTAQAPWSGYGDPIVDDHLHGHLGEADDYVPRDWDEMSGGSR